MNEKFNIEERCRKILEEKGGEIAARSRTILLEDSALKDLRAPLEFIAKNWRDPLTPALMRLSCEAVGGQAEETFEVALAMSLMNLSFRIWDDIIDRAPFKLFKPTLFGKFGEGSALIIGGLASAKAFSILNEIDIDKPKRKTITRLFWNLWTKMAKAETVSLKLRRKMNYSSKEKLWKIKTEAAAALETCMRIGANIGGGSESEIHHLGQCGLNLGIAQELWKDFYVSTNLTLELDAKIRNGTLPYFLLWAKERSEKIQSKLGTLSNENAIDPLYIQEIVKDIIEVKTLDHAINTIRKHSKKAKEELCELEKNVATDVLSRFVEMQPQLFIESLSMV